MLYEVITYKGHAQQFMHAFWGVGQMSFVKHAIFVGEDAPHLEDFEALTTHILNRLDPSKVLITQGILDHLDHSSDEQFVGGKLGVDATGDEMAEGLKSPLSDIQLLKKMQDIDKGILGLKQYRITSYNVCYTKLLRGESQITGQVKDAFKLSMEHGTAGEKLNRVLSYAIKCAAEVRNATNISQNPISIARNNFV